jgi:thiol-disulfide isomerase/thioredoxin
LNKLIFVILLTIRITFAQELVNISSVDDIAKIKNENNGKILVFNFWASWCKPCVKELPDLIKLNRDYKDRNIKLIIISLDFKEEVDLKLLPFLKDNNIDFPSYLLDVKDPDDIMNYFDSKWNGGIPATFIFDTSGQLKKFILGAHDYVFFENEIKKLI